MNNVACITGITGQDGSYLASSLLSRGYEVIGLHRRSSTENFSRIKDVIGHPLFHLQEFDLTDASNVSQTIIQYQPDEFYNLAAQSHVGTSFNQPNMTIDVNTIGVVNILESIRHHSPRTRLYQASTSEMFGSNFKVKGLQKYQDEDTSFSPQSPYAVSKVAAHNMIRLYRNSYELYACSGILFNHESPRRGENFVTRKITKWIGQFMRWKGDREVECRAYDIKAAGTAADDSTFHKLRLGNLEAKRDWGHAKDYVEAMRMMLNQNEPKDYVIATGETHSVKEFLQAAFSIIELNYEDYTISDSDLYRPSEVDYLLGDSSLARKELGWIPQISFEHLVREMVESDIKANSV